jgi:hypothetical protein
MFARVQRKGGRQIITSTHSADLFNDEGVGLDEVLLLASGQQGTVVQSAKDVTEIRELLEGGVPLGEAIMPRVAPRLAAQLSFFGD